MSYNRENYIRIKREFDKKHLEAQSEADHRREELHLKFPDLARIDRALSEMGIRVFGEAMKGKENLEERIEKIHVDLKELRAVRKEWMERNGFPEDYTEPSYECAVCQDTGSVGHNICVCMHRALILSGYESSGIGKLIKTQSFETFDLSYYSENEQTLKTVTDNYNFCKRYAVEFNGEDTKNLLMLGNTGLGKTHLSTSIAKVVIESGYDVSYETAQNIFADFETERFGRSYENEAKNLDMYFDCDLLIIDDLGAEMTNQFTISCLYNIINTRINRNKSTIINTNLTADELRRKYNDRITSRLLGEFYLLRFLGKDIRAQKIERTMKNNSK